MMNRITGQRLDPQSDAHLEQSIGDILTTPLNQRIALRAYGSELPDLIDQPLNGVTRMRIYAATAMALLRWEPRLRLKRVELEASASGRAGLRLEYLRVDRPRRPLSSLFVPLSIA